MVRIKDKRMKAPAIVFVVVCLLACRGEQGPAGPTLTGNISGYVALFSDSIPSLPLADASGVTVSALPLGLTTTSGMDGLWELKGVPAGIYEIRFSKTGFYPRIYPNFQFVGGGTYYFYSITLASIPQVQVLQFTMMEDFTNSRIQFAGSIDAPGPQPRQIGIVLSTTPIVLPGLFECDALGYATVPTDSVNFTGWYYLDSDSPFRGSNLYARAFVEPRYYWSPSYDPATRRYRFDAPGVSFSDQRVVAVP